MQEKDYLRVVGFSISFCPFSHKVKQYPITYQMGTGWTQIFSRSRIQTKSHLAFDVALAGNCNHREPWQQLIPCCSKWRLWSKIFHLAIQYNCWYRLSNERRQFAWCSWRFVTSCQQFGTEEHPCACGRIPDLFRHKLNNKKPQRENCAIWCWNLDLFHMKFSD